MFRAYVAMIQLLGFLTRKGKNLLNAGGVWDVSGRLGLWTHADLFFHRRADRLQIKTHLLENIHGHTLTEVNQAE